MGPRAGWGGWRPEDCGKEEARLHGFNWFSVERWVDVPLCENFGYVVVLRDAVSRTLHMFKHLLMLMFHDLFIGHGDREEDILSS